MSVFLRFEVPGYDVASFERRHTKVGGGRCGAFRLDNEHWGIFIAESVTRDESALLTLSEMVKLEAFKSTSPSEILVRINRAFQDLDPGVFFTLQYAILSILEHRLRVASAGHQPMLICNGMDGRMNILEESGLALGIAGGKIFDQTLREEETRLAKGDRIVLYTEGAINDAIGLTEDFSQSQLLLDLSRLSDRASHSFLRRVVHELDIHDKRNRQPKALALLTVRRVT